MFSMTDNCDLLLRAAMVLDVKHQPMSMEDMIQSAPRPKDDYASVPDITDASSPMCDDSEMEDESTISSEDARRRPRLAAMRVSRSFIARDSIAHNSVEKRRRAYLASCYDALKNAIPALAGSRASNVKVLRNGAALIKVNLRDI
jgi:hypothetical protein